MVYLKRDRRAVRGFKPSNKLLQSSIPDAGYRIQGDPGCIHNVMRQQSEVDGTFPRRGVEGGTIWCEYRQSSSFEPIGKLPTGSIGLCAPSDTSSVEVPRI